MRGLHHLMGVIRTAGRDSPYELKQIGEAAAMLSTHFGMTDVQVQKTSNLMVAFAHRARQEVEPQMEQLSRVLAKLEGVRDVFSVHRDGR